METQIAAIKAFIAADSDDCCSEEKTPELEHQTSVQNKNTVQKHHKSIQKKDKMKAVDAADLKSILFNEESELSDEKQQVSTPDSEVIEEKPEFNKKEINKPIECKAYSINIESNFPVEEDDEEKVLGQNILRDLKIDNDKCSVLRLQKCYYDNGCEKLFIDRWHVKLTMLDDMMKVLDEKIVTWKSLSAYHQQLRARGLERHKESDDPHQNWMPNIINLDLG